MQTSIQDQTAVRPTPTETTTQRLRTISGNRWPRKCACGCDQKIPRDPGIRFVVDFGVPQPYPAYLREHSTDYPGRKPSERKAHPGDTCPGFVPASLLLEASKEAGGAGEKGSSFYGSLVPRDPAHADDESSPSPQAGRAWASGQLVFNAGQFESARSGYADYARDGETGQQLRTRVNRVILEDLELKVIALRQLHEKLRDRIGGPSLGDFNFYVTGAAYAVTVTWTIGYQWQYGPAQCPSGGTMLVDAQMQAQANLLDVTTNNYAQSPSPTVTVFNQQSTTCGANGNSDANGPFTYPITFQVSIPSGSTDNWLVVGSLLTSTSALTYAGGVADAGAGTWSPDGSGSTPNAQITSISWAIV